MPQSAPLSLSFSVAAPPALGPGDFVYLGSYRHPAPFPHYERLHIAFRRVAGERRLFVAGANSPGFDSLREYAVLAEPGLEQTAEAALPSLAPRTAYDTLMGAKRPPKPAGTVGNVEAWGIDWDEEEQRLYWQACVDYVTGGVPPSWPHFGYSTLSGSTATPYGPWGVTGTLCQRSYTNWTGKLPQAWADAHAQGRRRLLGAGFYHSINAQVCAGLALGAVESPDPASVAEGGTYPLAVLSEYQRYGQADPLHHARRSGGYNYVNGTGPEYQPDATGEGRATTEMAVLGSACWIDLPDGRSGLLALTAEGKGDIAYHQSGYWAAGGTGHYWHFWDAAGLARVAAGTLHPFDLPTSARWQVRYPERWTDAGAFKYSFDPAAGLYPSPSGAESQRYRTKSACYDPVERRLYVLQSQVFGWTARSAIHVYRAGGA